MIGEVMWIARRVGMGACPFAVNCPSVSLLGVHKGACDSTWARVEVLVRAPARKVHTPVMELEHNIAHSVRQVKANDAALGDTT